MRHLVEKTIVAKINYNSLTQTKQQAIDHEYDAFQNYINGDTDADLYSATKQAADKYIEEEIENRDYPWFVRNDVVEIEYPHSLEQHKTELSNWWLEIPVSQVYRGVRVPITPHNNIPEEAELKDSKIVKDNGEYYAHLTVQVKRDINEEYDDVIGVDFGVRWVATAVLLSDRSTRFYGEEVRQKRRQSHRLRSKLQEKSAFETLENVKDSESRFVEDQLHKISRDIVNWAEKENALIIVGDLNGIQDDDKGSEMNRRLHSMPHYKLKQFIEYKALWDNVAVLETDEYMTSQTCNWCGEQEKSSRQLQGFGLEDNGDKNGALNIVKRRLGKDIDRISVDFPLSDLGTMNGLVLEPSTNDDADAQDDYCVSIRSNLETPSSKSEGEVVHLV
jgi:putative transposase